MNPRYENAEHFELAALYAQGIALNHPFIDGNKRTAMTVADVFLGLNGYHLQADQKQLADMMVALAEKKISSGELAAFFLVNCGEL